jgi:hypothetical protein
VKARADAAEAGVRVVWVERDVHRVALEQLVRQSVEPSAGLASTYSCKPARSS